MTGRSAIEHRVLSALDESPRRVPFVLGFCGSGRTSLLRAVQKQRGPRTCQYVDVEHSATTPERFYVGLLSTSPFRLAEAPVIRSPRDAFDATVRYLTLARSEAGRPAIFLLDGVLEFRTFESFPGLRGVVGELLAALATTENRFVLASRYAARAERLLAAPGPFVRVLLPPLNESEIRDSLLAGNGHPPTAGPASTAFEDEARMIQALADGRPAYVADLCEQIALLAPDGGSDPISALTALLSSNGRLAARCGHCYELRLHRARGYGALKAILDILAEETGLTLTEIAQRLHRTPGSTRDYLSWLEDVDLVAMTRKRYAFTDPVLRLWVRLHCRPVPPQEEEVAREVQRYALERLAQPAATEPASA